VQIPLKCQIYGAVQKFGPLAQPRNIRLKMSPDGIVVGDFIQAAYAVQDNRHPTEQDGDEGGHCAENEGGCRRLRHDLCKLTRIGDENHESTASGNRRLIVRAGAIFETGMSS
jgi:hypothetical protein